MNFHILRLLSRGMNSKHEQARFVEVYFIPFRSTDAVELALKEINVLQSSLKMG